MFQSLSPLWIMAAVFAGSVLAPVLGWFRAHQNSKAAQKANPDAPPLESFDWMKLLSSGMIGVVAAFLLFIQYSTKTSVAAVDMQTAFVAGFGADKVVKNIIGI